MSGAEVQVIMMIRHGEKPAEHGRPHGVAGDGGRDAHSLTVAGWVRAGAIMELFAPVHGEPPAPLRRPDIIYGTAHGGHSKRSVQTLLPVAFRIGLEVITDYGEGDEKKLARELRHRDGTALVCWHHNSLMSVVRHLGTVDPDPPPCWPEDRFDVVWTFTREGGRTWRFEQVPELLLPGDLDYPIAV